MRFIKDVSEANSLWKNEDVIFVDCRFDLIDPTKGRQEFFTDHLPGAVYFDLEQDLSSPVKSTGGRHPLPDIEVFVKKLESVGIDQNKTVIAYDNGHAFASRFCWLMYLLGAKHTYLLNGGYKAWKHSGYLLEVDEVKREKATFNVNIQSHLAVDQADVKEKMQDKQVVLIDSRNYKRYAGKFEPIDPKAGHIPGAKNYDWMSLFTEEGFWKSEEQLQNHFKRLQIYDEIIVYCGSGVTATPNILGLWEAGFTNTKLYVGSWSDWITNPLNPIAP